MQYVHVSPVVQRGTQEVRKWTLAGGETWEGTKVVAPPPPRARAFPLHHAQTFLAKVKTKSKLKISIAEFYVSSQF